MCKIGDRVVLLDEFGTPHHITMGLKNKGGLCVGEVVRYVDGEPNFVHVVWDHNKRYATWQEGEHSCVPILSIKPEIYGISPFF